MSISKKFDQWDSSSKRHTSCPMCKKSFADCSHSIIDVEKWFKKQILKEEIVKVIKKLK